MELYMPTMSDYPKGYRLGLFFHVGNAMEACCKRSGKQLTWTWYGNVAQANEAIQYTITKMTTDDEP
jgi:hypothetical protein